MKKIALFLILMFSFSICFGQRDKNTENNDYQSKVNIVKLSLTSLAFKNFQFSYERALKKVITTNLSYSFIPNGSIPLKGSIEKYVDDEEIESYLDDLRISYSSITPEVRFYLGKGYGKGFYIAPFARFSSYKISGLNVEYESDEGEDIPLEMTGKLKGTTFGLLFGSQFNIGSFIIDWWIMGPHYGSAKGELKGTSNTSLSATERQFLEEELNEIKIGSVDSDIEINSDNAILKLKGPWGGIRAGIGIGYRF